MPQVATYSVIELSNGQRVVVDVTLSESVTREAEVTEYPVESGGTISDNIRPKPIVISFEGIISNTPIAPISAIRTQGIPAAKDMRERLEQAFDARDTCKVILSSGAYANMAFEFFDCPRDQSTGDSLRFTARFKQITTVTNARVKTATRNGGGKVKRGGQPVFFRGSKAMIWRKGIIYKFAANKKFDAAGAPQFVYSGGAPDIGDTEVVYWVEDQVNGFWVHQDQKTPLTTSEVRRLKLDLDRDFGRLRSTPVPSSTKKNDTLLPEYDQTLNKHLNPINIQEANRREQAALPPHLRNIEKLPDGFKL